MDEVLIDESGDDFQTRFGPVRSAPWFGCGLLRSDRVAPVMFVGPDKVRDALQPGGDDSFGGVVATATREGLPAQMRRLRFMLDRTRD